MSQNICIADFWFFFDKNAKEYQNHQNHDQIQEASNFTTESIAGMYLDANWIL